MAADTRIRECPERGCTGSLWTAHHACTMRCACDTCRGEFLVAYVGVTERWEESPAWFRQLALDAIREAAEWKRRFAEANKRIEEKREREKRVANARLCEDRLRNERMQAEKKYAQEQKNRMMKSKGERPTNITPMRRTA